MGKYTTPSQGFKSLINPMEMPNSGMRLAYRRVPSIGSRAQINEDSIKALLVQILN